VRNIKEAQNAVFNSSIQGLASGITGAISVGVLFATASPLVLAGAGFIAGFNAVVSIVGFSKCSKSKQQLEKLRKEMDEVEAIKREAVELKAQLVLKTEQILNAIIEFTENEEDTDLMGL